MRKIVAGLGVFSIVIALVLAGLGMFAIHRQGTGLDRVILLKTALRNLQAAKSAVDDIRANVLRSLSELAAWNQESTAAINSDLWTHAAAARNGIHENLDPRPPALHGRYWQEVDVLKAS